MNMNKDLEDYWKLVWKMTGSYLNESGNIDTKITLLIFLTLSMVTLIVTSLNKSMRNCTLGIKVMMTLRIS